MDFQGFVVCNIILDSRDGLLKGEIPLRYPLPCGEPIKNLAYL